MRIAKIHINNFGKLSDVTYEIGDVFSLCEDNGYGKSTIVSFVAAMLYGLPTVRTNAKSFSDREHYLPFSGGSFGGYMDVVYKDKEYHIERTFDAKKAGNDVLTVYLDGNITNELGSVPGETIFGINKESFLRLITIDSNEFSLGTDDDINQKLNNYVEHVGEEFDIQKVLGAIKAKKKEFSDAKKNAYASLVDAKYKAKDLEIMKNKREELSQAYAVAKKNYEESQNAYENASKNAAILERWKLCDSLLEKATAAKENFDFAIRRRADYDIQKKTAKRGTKPDALSIVMIILGALIAAAGVCVFFLLKKYRLYGVIAAIFGALVLIVGIIRCVNVVKREKNARKEVEKNMDNEILTFKKEYEDALKTADEFKKMNGLSVRPDDSLDYENLRKKSQEMLAEYNRLFAETSKIDDDINEAETITQSIEELKKEQDAMAENEQFYSTLMEEISAADISLKEKYVDPIQKRFRHYSNVLETVFGDKLVMDNDYNVKYEDGGALRDARHLSTGNYAILALCFRLSLLDNMFGDEKPFIVFDDPFSALDAKNLEKALSFVRFLSQEKQILYFCCHESRTLS